ncbi:thiamine-phosphate kinase [Polynucleobacter sp. 30F-ANTBAC]|uniref:thiamine-phosphate kinase n=1 Tax=Polynucleobacter sp. 30F-ANTBAC TaxID=2689095 RepID=UPI001C0CBD3A|nr:thiamine-phosphate kinase [Polynucleobacter sp. 30F-ANTBAC]MBU3599705.1 thiamine-phosphate kinase [Polynucleobacter sp. 30F-ANTBAC]
MNERPETNPLGEFDLIERFFKRPLSNSNPQILLGIGDDCALISCSAKDQPGALAISTDMLIEGRHFLPGADPGLLGHKALAVNLSDLAAMGATPTAFTLAIAMPEAKAEWLEDFSNGLLKIANHYHCPLIGGDTTAGPLTISITVFGRVNHTQALQRSNAQLGDDIWISGTVGDARLALGAIRQEWLLTPAEMALVAPRMHAPTPRIVLGQKLLGIAHAAVDVSDGLLGDLSHILKMSQVGAEIEIDQIPRSDTLSEQALERQRLCTLMGGDDYELCFTAPRVHRKTIQSLAKELDLNLTKIGVITPPTPSLMILLDDSGQILPAEESQHYLNSFDHFKTAT